MTLTTSPTFDYSALDAEARIVVQQKTAEIQDRLRDIKGKFIEIGDRLIAVKAQLVHGEWGAWLEAEFDWSQDTAERLMNAARFANQIPQFADFGGLFTRTAMAKLGATTTPTAAVDEAVQRAQSGEPINDVKAAQIITAHRPAAVRPSTQGAEPDTDEDGLPLVDHLNQRVNDRLAEQVELDEEDEDEGFRLGDVVEFRGHRCTVIAVMSSGNISIRTPIGYPLRNIDPDVEVVTLIERAPERPAVPRLSIVPKVEPAKPEARLVPVVDGMKISESHPVGYAALYATDDAMGYGKATCAACGQTHNGWTAVPAGRWKCRCGATTNDDALETSGRAEYELEQRLKTQRTATGHKPSIAPLMTSDSPEWYTPADIIALVRNVLGTIDLDPASCAEANKVVQAKTYFDDTRDGLAQPWSGQVYLNPPYGDEIKTWVKRLVQDYESGAVKEAILLVPSRSDTEWYRMLRAYPRCLVYGRLKFWGNGSTAGAPFPSAVFYLGPTPRTFVKHFSSIGDVFRLWDEGDES